MSNMVAPLIGLELFDTEGDRCRVIAVVADFNGAAIYVYVEVVESDYALGRIFSADLEDFTTRKIEEV